MATSAQHGPTAEGSAPRIVVLAGPNGAGKSTSAQRVLRGALQVDEFVNADIIARGLSQFDPASVAIEAGRVMLKRLRELAAQRATFAFETTLASRCFAHWIRELQATGYEFRLVYLWLRSAELAAARVGERVRRGGHNVPIDIITRRYESGCETYFCYIFRWPISGKCTIIVIKQASWHMARAIMSRKWWSLKLGIASHNGRLTKFRYDSGYAERRAPGSASGIRPQTSGP